MAARGGHVFVTVGTTEFEALVEVASSDAFARSLRQHGFARLVVQYGRGSPPTPPQVEGLEVELYDYKPSLAGDIAGASIVVSHAGAGTCLECLEAGKPLLVVVNEVLADNHQLELASKLKEDGYLEYTTPSEVIDAFCTLADGKHALRPFTAGNSAPFAVWLNNLTGASPPSPHK